MSPSIRTLLASFLIAAVAPVGLAALDLEQPAFAGNGNGNGGGNGGGHGGGNGGGHGGGHGGDHGNSGNAKSADADTRSHKSIDDSESDGLSPNELGKLNGIIHASPNAIAHASANSPKGIAREFGEALAGFLDSAETPADPAAGEETPGEETQGVTVDQLGEMMARMTNKPVTAEQVQAVAEKVAGIEPEDEAAGDEAAGDEATGDEATGDDQASEDPSEGGEAPKLDQETAQAIADKANEIHGFDTGDDTTDDGDDTADAGDDTGDETVTN